MCTASRYRLATMHHLRRTERRASNSPPRGCNTAPTVRRAKPHTCVVHEVLTGGAVHGVFHLMAAWHACCALSATPSSASWHDRCRWAARQTLMRTASWHVRLARHAEINGTLYGTCRHAVRRVQLARPAYAAFSSVSSAICARSSVMPAGSLSDVLGVSTAAPTGEIVPQWEVYG